MTKYERDAIIVECRMLDAQNARMLRNMTQDADLTVQERMRIYEESIRISETIDELLDKIDAATGRSTR